MAISDEDLQALLTRGNADLVVEMVEELVNELLETDDTEEYKTLLDILSENSGMARIALDYLAAKLGA